MNAIRPKVCGNCACRQNFHTKKFGEIMVLLRSVKTRFCMLLSIRIYLTLDIFDFMGWLKKIIIVCFFCFSKIFDKVKIISICFWVGFFLVCYKQSWVLLCFLLGWVSLDLYFIETERIPVLFWWVLLKVTYFFIYLAEFY